MKAMKTILVVMAAAGLAMAQAPATSKPKAPASQTVSGAAATMPTPAAKTPAKKPAAAMAAAPASKPAKSPAKPKAAKKAVVTAVAKSPAKPATPAAAKVPAGKRDPFVNPVVRVAAGGGTGSMCSTGKRCLMINEMVLRGIVKTQGGNIAVVSNSANRAYFLKESDPVFNGMVMKITGDSVVFKENVVDNLGRETTREVVKRVTAPTV